MSYTLNILYVTYSSSKLASVVLLLGIGVLLLIKAAGAVVNLITLWPTGEVDY